MRSAEDLAEALAEVWWSANSDAAITYRQRVGLFTRPSIAVVVQSLLDPDSAGVMFTQNPVTGDHERLVEANGHGNGWFAERYVDGREFNLSLVEVEGRPVVLPPADSALVASCCTVEPTASL